jgi:excisionase family DNA binding protein
VGLLLEALTQMVSRPSPHFSQRPQEAGAQLEEQPMGINQLPDMLTVEEAAKVLRISRSRAYEAVATFQRTGGAEGLPSIRIGRSLRVPKGALLGWIDAQLSGDHVA